MYAILLALVIGPAVERLGSDSWGRRECAEERLRSLKCLAWPALLGAADSPDPEVRHRVHRLLAPYRVFALDLRAAAVLTDPWPLPPSDLARLMTDEELCRRCHRLATAAGCNMVWHLLPENWPGEFWVCQWTAAQLCEASLTRARDHLGHRSPGWPFNQPHR